MKLKRKMEYRESTKSLHTSKLTSSLAHARIPTAPEQCSSASVTAKTDTTGLASHTNHETVHRHHDCNATVLLSSQDHQYEDDGYASASSSDKVAQPGPKASVCSNVSLPIVASTTGPACKDEEATTPTTARFGKLSLSRQGDQSGLGPFQGPAPIPFQNARLQEPGPSQRQGQRRGDHLRHHSHSISLSNVHDPTLSAEGTTTGTGTGTGIRTLLLPEMVRAKGVKLISPTSLISDTRMRSHTFPCDTEGGTDDHAGQTRGHRRTLSMPAHLWQVQHQPPLDFFVRSNVVAEATARQVAQEEEEEAVKYVRDTDLDTVDEEYIGLAYHHVLDEDNLENNHDDDMGNHNHHHHQHPSFGQQHGNDVDDDNNPPRAGVGSRFRTFCAGTDTHPIRLVFVASDTPTSAFQDEDESKSSVDVKEHKANDNEGDIIIEAWVVDDDSASNEEMMMDLMGGGDFPHPFAFGGGAGVAAGLPFGYPNAGMEGFEFGFEDEGDEDDDENENEAGADFRESMMAMGLTHPMLFGQDGGLLDGEEEAMGPLLDFMPSLHHLDPSHPLASIVELEEDRDEDDEGDMLDELLLSEMRYEETGRSVESELAGDEHDEMAAFLDAAARRQTLFPEQCMNPLFAGQVDRLDGADGIEDDDGLEGEDEDEDDMEFVEMMRLMAQGEILRAPNLFVGGFEDDHFHHHYPPMLERGSSPFAKYIKQVRPYHSDGYYSVSSFKAGNEDGKQDEGCHSQETLCEFQGRVYRAERGVEKRDLKRRKMEEGREGGEGQEEEEEKQEEEREREGGSRIKSMFKSGSLHGCRPRSALDRRVGCWRRLKEVR